MLHCRNKVINGLLHWWLLWYFHAFCTFVGFKKGSRTLTGLVLHTWNHGKMVLCFQLHIFYRQAILSDLWCTFLYLSYYKIKGSYFIQIGLDRASKVLVFSCIFRPSRTYWNGSGSKPSPEGEVPSLHIPSNLSRLEPAKSQTLVQMFTSGPSFYQHFSPIITSSTYLCLFYCSGGYKVSSAHLSILNSCFITYHCQCLLLWSLK